MRSFVRYSLALGVSALTVPSLAHAGDPETLAAPEDVDPAVYGGIPSPECAWPSTVYVGGCTGTLVHPQVVIYAAHCGSGVNRVTFGERDSQPARQVTTTTCRTNPAYSGGASGRDHAFCVLSQPVTDVPIVPILMGCEAGALQPGTEVDVVGFGYNSSSSNSIGIKHQVTTTLNNISGDEAYIGGGGLDSCNGDSGGPVYVKLPDQGTGPGQADGTWRVFGITSYGPAHPNCGSGGWYSMMHIGMPWIESELESFGIDLTPCHDSAGNWQPGPECFGFPQDARHVGGSWSSGCEAGPLGAWGAVCGEPFNNEPDDTPPTVTVTAPMDQQIFDSMGAGEVTIPIAVDAQDEGWGVQEVALLIDGAEIATDNVAPYEWATVSFPAGQYSISAIATDFAGNEATSNVVNIAVDMDPEPPDPTTTGTTGTGTDGGGMEVGTGSGSTGPMGDDGPEDPTGCGCTTSNDAGGGAAALGLFGLIAFRRRRR